MSQDRKSDRNATVGNVIFIAIAVLVAVGWFAAGDAVLGLGATIVAIMMTVKLATGYHRNQANK